MGFQAGDDGEETVAWLIADDGAGRFFAIAWQELLRFRVPGLYLASIEALVTGAEPVSEADVSGYSGSGAGGDLDPRLTDLVMAVASGRGRPAARRLRVWALLP